MSWDFDQELVLVELANIIEDIVGASLPFLSGNSGDKAVYITHSGGIEPALPHIMLTYEGSADDDGTIIATGLIDQVIDGVTVTVPYYDKVVNFGITIVSESMPVKQTTPYTKDKTNAMSLLREIRKALLLPQNRKKLRDRVFTVMAFMQSIQSTPDLQATEYHDIGSMLLKLTSVDRYIDLEERSFDTINVASDLALSKDSPSILSGSNTYTSIV